MSGAVRQRLNQLDALRGLAAMAAHQGQTRCRLGRLRICLAGRNRLAVPLAAQVHLRGLDAPPTTSKINGGQGLWHRHGVGPGHVKYPQPADRVARQKLGLSALLQPCWAATGERRATRDATLIAPLPFALLNSAESPGGLP